MVYLLAWRVAAYRLHPAWVFKLKMSLFRVLLILQIFKERLLKKIGIRVGVVSEGSGMSGFSYWTILLKSHEISTSHWRLQLWLGLQVLHQISSSQAGYLQPLKLQTFSFSRRTWLRSAQTFPSSYLKTPYLHHLTPTQSDFLKVRPLESLQTSSSAHPAGLKEIYESATECRQLLPQTWYTVLHPFQLGWPHTA